MVALLRASVLTLVLIQSSAALVLTGVRDPTIRGGSGVGQLQARLSEEDGGVCIKLEENDAQE